MIEAPASMRGKEIACPGCEATNVLLSPEDAHRREAQASVQAERERRTFLDALAKRQRGAPVPQGPRSYAAPAEGVPTQDLVLLAARRLKDISVYLLAFAYLLLLLAVGLGLSLAIWADLAGVWKGFAFGLGTFVGVTVFIVFKYMSDTVRAIADLTDLGRSLDERLAYLTQPVSSTVDTTGGLPDGPPADQVLSQNS